MDFEFEIYLAKTPEDVDRKTRLAFVVPDLQGAMNLLRKDDASVAEEVKKSPWGLRGVVRYMLMKTPDFEWNGPWLSIADRRSVPARRAEGLNP